MDIALDKQLVTKLCPKCGIEFPVARGSVFDSGVPIGLYLIALHGHSPDGNIGHLAIAIVDQSMGEPRPIAAAVTVVATPQEFGFKAIDWASSPWAGESYLGQMLNNDEVRSSPHRQTFFHIAEHVVEDIPEVREYFNQPL